MCRLTVRSYDHRNAAAEPLAYDVARGPPMHGESHEPSRRPPKRPGDHRAHRLRSRRKWWPGAVRCPGAKSRAQTRVASLASATGLFRAHSAGSGIIETHPGRPGPATSQNLALTILGYPAGKVVPAPFASVPDPLGRKVDLTRQRWAEPVAQGGRKL